MNELYSITNILNILFIIAASVGGYMAFRSGKHRTSSEIQDQTTNAQDKAINALNAEIEALQRRFGVLERENARLNMTINLIKRALSQRGMIVSIDGDMVTIVDRKDGQTTSYSHIQETTPPQPSKASKAAPASQWARKTWLEGDTIADLPKTEE